VPGKAKAAFCTYHLLFQKGTKGTETSVGLEIVIGTFKVGFPTYADI
jgi:hypothetical protein